MEVGFRMWIDLGYEIWHEVELTWRRIMGMRWVGVREVQGGMEGVVFFFHLFDFD
jgi:hypothetical protein